MKKFICFFTLIIILLTCTVTADAQGTRNYVYNEYAECINAPCGYIADKVITGSSLGIGDFKGISDLYIDDFIYIADSGNNRIVLLDKDFNFVRQVDSVVENGKNVPLKNPSGVFAANEIMYICDTDNNRAVGIDNSGVVKRLFTMPETELLADDFEFKPSKISVNSADTVFLVCSGIYQGLLQYGSDDSFIGFFGANKVEVTPTVLVRNIWKNIFSDEQRESLVRTIPTEYTNLYIDSEDMIYTATATTDTKQVKKLNASGEDILVYPGSSGSLLQKGYNRNNFGDQHYSLIKGKPQKSTISDVCIDSDDVIGVLDSKHGKVFLYDSEQNPLCIFGGSGSQLGFFENASSLEKVNNSYIVADSETNSITVFKETEYMSYIRKALNCYKSGNYRESADNWKKVIDRNSALSVAYKGMGRTLLIDGDYKKAIEYLKIGDDRYYYSMAISQYRREYLRKNFIWLLPVAIVSVVLFVLLIKKIKKAILNSSVKKGIGVA